MFRMFSFVFLRGRRLKMIFIKRRVTNDQCILGHAVIQPDIRMDNMDTVIPFAMSHVGCSLPEACLIEFCCINHAVASLSQQEGKNSCACTDIQNFPFRRC